MTFLCVELFVYKPVHFNHDADVRRSKSLSSEIFDNHEEEVSLGDVIILSHDNTSIPSNK
jgi:hypothetical protein